MENIVVAITGASGVAYAQRLLQVLIEQPLNIHLIVSEAAVKVIEQELDLRLGVDNFDVRRFLQIALNYETNRIFYHCISDLGVPIASGEFPVKAMIIVPCTMNTLSAIATGIASNLIERAASVTLKEGRKLVLVPRETPLTTIHIENMLKLARAGACLLPAMPGFYHNPKTIEDLVNFVVAKILSYLQIK